MKKRLSALALALAGMLLSMPGSAVLLSFSPATATGGVGSTFNVDIWASGLGDRPGSDTVISLFEITVLFDPAVLSLNSAVYTNALGDPNALPNPEAVYDPVVSGSGSAYLLAFSYMDSAYPDLNLGFPGLLTYQPADSVRLATLQFQGDAVGSSSLQFDASILLDVAGAPLPLTTDSACIGVGQGANCTQQVPEPTLPSLLLGMGLAWWMARRYSPV